MTVQVAKLRDRVVYQEYVRADDGQGGFSERWENAGRFWAEIRPLSAREIFFAGKVRAGVTHAGSMRYTPAVSERGRVLWRGRTLEVASAINVDGRDRQLDLLLEEVRDAG